MKTSNYQNIGFALMAALILSAPSFSLASTTPSSDQATKMASLVTRANAEIVRRVTALNAVNAKINSLKRLNASQKTSFTTQIQQNVSDLTTLKVKIDADTDPTTLKSDVQSIVNSYRIFYIFIPQVHVLASVDAINVTTTNLSTLATDLQQRIAIASSNGKNITTMTATLADMNANIAAANTLADTVSAEVTPLTPASYPGGKDTLQNAVTNIKTARTDITVAQTDAKTIMTGLKAAE